MDVALSRATRCAKLVALFVAVFMSSHVAATTQPSSNFPVTNGTVYAVAEQGANVYVGGDFTYIGPNTGRGAELDANVGATRARFPRLSGGSSVLTSIPDGEQGWYVGGDFTTAEGQSYPSLVHVTVDADGRRSLDTAFAPAPNGVVRALALDSATKTLYVGGDFTAIGGGARSYLAAVDAETGTLKGWAPQVNNTVYALTLDDTGATLYAGGNFTSVLGDASARGLIALATGASAALAWATPADMAIDAGAVRALALDTDNAVLYVGGTFAQLGGNGRTRLGAVDLGTETVTAWNPSADGPIYALLYDGVSPAVYAGGSFANAGSKPRTNLARFKTDDATADDTFAPNPDGTISAMAFTLESSGAVSRVIIGGEFTHIGATARAYVGAVSPRDGAVVGTWAPLAIQPVRNLTRSENNALIFAGGEFSTIGGQTRQRLASFSRASGTINGWAPAIKDGSVRALAVTADGGNIYVGGDFTGVGDQGQARLARIYTDDGTLSAWRPSIPAGSVRALALARNGAAVRALAVDPVDPQIVYAGAASGLYKSSNGGETWTSTTNALSGLDVRVLLFDPNTPSTVYAGTWGGGMFKSTDGGTTWTAYNEGLDARNVFSLAIKADSSELYVGTQINRTGSNSGLSKRATSGGEWKRVVPGEATALDFDPLNPDIIYIGSVSGVLRFDTTKTETRPEDLLTQGLSNLAVASIAVSRVKMADSDDATVYVAAGAVVYRSHRTDLLDDKGNPDEDANGNPIKTTAWTAIANGLPNSPIEVLTFDPSNPDVLYVATADAGVYKSSDNGAHWSDINSGLPVKRMHALALDPRNPAVLYSSAGEGFIYKTADAGSSWNERREGIPIDAVYVGGDFTGTPSDYLAALTASSSSADYFMGWSSGSSGPVNALSLSADRRSLYAAGSFTLIGGAARSRIAALSPDTAAAQDWNPGVDDGEVRSIALDSDERTLYLGGTFTRVGGVARNYLAAVPTASSTVADWNPAPNGAVNGLRVADFDNVVIAAGEFTQIGGDARNYLASLFANSNTATAWAPNPDQAMTSSALSSSDSDTGFALFAGGEFSNVGNTTSPSLVHFVFTAPSTHVTPVAQSYNSPQQIAVSCVETDDDPAQTQCLDSYYSIETNPDRASFQVFSTPIELHSNLDLTVYSVSQEGVRGAGQTHKYVYDYDGPAIAASVPSGTYPYSQVVYLQCTDLGSAGDAAAGCAEAFYTSDGSDPTFRQTSDEAGIFVYEPTGTTLKYRDFIVVPIQTTLRFIGVDKAGNASAVDTTSYTIVRGEEGGSIDWAWLLLVGAALCANSRGKRRCASRC